MEKALLKIEEQDKIIIKLQNELLKYKNPNTPSSSNKHLKPDTSGKQSKENSKRGAPIGHIGKTREQIPQKKKIINFT